jgi:hypothetical protein
MHNLRRKYLEKNDIGEVKMTNKIPIYNELDISNIEPSIAKNNLDVFINTSSKTNSSDNEEIDSEMKTVLISNENELYTEIMKYFEDKLRVNVGESMISINFLKEYIKGNNNAEDFWNKMNSLFVYFSQNYGSDFKLEKINQTLQTMIQTHNYKEIVYRGILSLNFIHSNNQKILLDIQKDIIIFIIQKLYSCQEIIGFSRKIGNQPSTNNKIIITEIPNDQVNDETNATDNIELPNDKTIPEIECIIINFLKLHNSSILSNEELIVPITIDEKTLGKYTLTPHRRHRRNKTHKTYTVYKIRKSADSSKDKAKGRRSKTKSKEKSKLKTSQKFSLF